MMKPIKITWLCEACGEEFSRLVKSTLIDEEDRVEVLVELLDGEEGPLCPCLTGTDTPHVH